MRWRLRQPLGKSEHPEVGKLMPQVGRSKGRLGELF
jgi:hypothetical protein